jgi:peptidoglycan/xylan/chitin deacetylase (PgdA/CDA1 family)
VLAPFAPQGLRWFRPPIGHVTLRIGRVAKRHEVDIVCWTVRGLDGLSGAEPSKVARRVCDHLDDGGIVALHEAFERGSGVPAGVGALPEILQDIGARGWRSVTLTELLVGSDDVDHAWVSNAANANHQSAGSAQNAKQDYTDP